jgi:uncharacterized protein (DUF3084 family)
MSEDIVARLRVLLSKCCIAPAMGVWSRDLRDAADEIERLREQLRLANIDNFNTTAEVDQVRAERDEARREVSCLRPSVCLGAQTANEYARERGWDCFK